MPTFVISSKELIVKVVNSFLLKYKMITTNHAVFNDKFQNIKFISCHFANSDISYKQWFLIFLKYKTNSFNFFVFQNQCKFSKFCLPSKTVNFKIISIFQPISIIGIMEFLFYSVIFNWSHSK